MSDEERTDGTEGAEGETPETPPEPVEDQPKPASEEQAVEAPAEEDAQVEASDDTATEDDPAAPGREAEEAAGSDVASGQDSDEAASAAAGGSDVDPEAAAGESDVEPEAPSEAKAKDVPPGADLEPISLEGEAELTAEERARLEAEAEERARLEAEATADPEEEPAPRRPATEIPADTSVQATGKRKSSIARVVVRPGNGVFEVNRRPLDEYFPRHHHRELARQPLAVSGFEETVDVRVRVQGGGISGQAGAIRHGVARALTEIDGELRRDLKRRGMLTRDARAKERRKAGLKKARKRPQFSKR
jgi:small subunit ribosomal protein S9